MIVFRDRPPTFHVQAWYDEVRDFSYPYPQECNPHCPYRCSGPVCTHYTQVKLHSRFNNLHFAMIQAISWDVLCSNSDIMFFFHSWFGPQPTKLAVPSMCAITWMYGGWSGPKLCTWSAITLPRKNVKLFLSFAVWYNSNKALLLAFVMWHPFHRGNWWGHAPYKHGTPCSACPPSYGGGCRNNLCYKGTKP